LQLRHPRPPLLIATPSSQTAEGAVWDPAHTINGFQEFAPQILE